MIAETCFDQISLFHHESSNTKVLTSENSNNNTPLSQNTGAFVYGSMSLLDKISNGIVIALIQHFHPDHCTPVDCPTARYYRYFSVL